MQKDIKIEWTVRDEDSIRGYLPDHPETTLFLLVSADPQGRVKLQGAFVPDGDEQELWDIQNAKAAAAEYMRIWLNECAPKSTDTARLDWMEQCLESHIIGRDSIEGDWFITLPHVAIVTAKEKTLRDAIDAAIQKTPNTEFRSAASTASDSKGSVQ